MRWEDSGGGLLPVLSTHPSHPLAWPALPPHVFFRTPSGAHRPLLAAHPPHTVLSVLGSPRLHGTILAGLSCPSLDSLFLPSHIWPIQIQSGPFAFSFLSDYSRLHPQMLCFRPAPPWFYLVSSQTAVVQRCITTARYCVVIYKLHSGF